MPSRIPKPGSLCDPHIFNLGDTFTTNYSFFGWNIDSIIKANAGDSAISYQGTPLIFCDVTSIFINGDLHSWTVDFTVIVTCKQDDIFSVTAKTTFSNSILPGRYSPPLGVVRYFNDGTNDTRGAILDSMCVLSSPGFIVSVNSKVSIRSASQDIGKRVYNAFVGSNFTTPAIISLQADFVFCPMSLGIAAPCSISRPTYGVPFVAAVYANSTSQQFDARLPIDPVGNPYILDDNSLLPFHNLLQAIYAAIRVDLGNPSLNNFILNPLLSLNGTIFDNFPVTPYNQDKNSTTSTLYSQLHDPDPTWKEYLPVNVSGPAQIQVAYACRFQRRKPLGPLIISVLVATLSMFSSGWAVFIVLATKFAKRTDPAGISPFPPLSHFPWLTLRFQPTDVMDIARDIV